MITTIYLEHYTTEIEFGKLKNENNYENRLFICDENLYAANVSLRRFWQTVDGKRRLILPSGEEKKSADTLFHILDAAFEADLDRSSTMVAVGGGVLTDMSGLAASLFKRGCAVVFYPTTLLSMVDAAIGGKTGIDYRGLKNMIGTFYPAQKVIIDLDFLQTLPEAEYRSGLGEVIKTAMLGDAELFKLLQTEKTAVLKRDATVLEEIVARCVKVKAAFVSDDFREKGARALLNFGHTFGHALEAVAGLGALSHGEAVVWGIDKSLQAAQLLGKENGVYYEEFRSMINGYGFDVDKSLADFDAFLKALSADKKSRGGELPFVLQSGLCETFQAPLSEEILKRVLLPRTSR